MSHVKPIPDGHPRVSVYLSVDGAAEAITFYEAVFDAKERMRLPAPGGKIGHAEIAIGDSVLMLADEYPEIDFRSPKALGGTPVTVNVYVEDVDAVFDRAVKLGARVLRPISNEFYGDRTGQFEDPFGHRWSVASRIENVSAEEMARRAAALYTA
jgi:PhnB protein